MKVILTTNIKKLGKIGDIVNVKAGYARNFLIPNNKAVRKTPENLKKLDSLYREFSTWARPDTLILNVDDEDLDREMNEILVFLGEK